MNNNQKYEILLSPVKKMKNKMTGSYDTYFILKIGKI